MPFAHFGNNIVLIYRLFTTSYLPSPYEALWDGKYCATVSLYACTKLYWLNIERINAICIVYGYRESHILSMVFSEHTMPPDSTVSWFLVAVVGLNWYCIGLHHVDIARVWVWAYTQTHAIIYST